MVRDYVTALYEPAAAAADARTSADGAGARDLAAWKAHVAATWSDVSVHVVTDGSDLAAGPSGDEREIVAAVDSAGLDPDHIVVQIVHGPLLADGSFDEHQLETVAMRPDGGSTYRAMFAPSGAGPWGATVRALPTHPGLSSIFDTGLVASG
jgi:glycogen phosphorylase